MIERFIFNNYECINIAEIAGVAFGIYFVIRLYLLARDAITKIKE